ncbi:MAG: LysR family transcriptional regulator [Clostridiales bacterium]|nr:LysR family transcriptional regulator [Clostridiales bacterium]
MDFLQLDYFRTAARYEHTTKAARELYISQPALSKMIRSLETELGVSLFDRTGNKIKLNPYGRILLDYANSVFNGAEDMKKMISDRKQTLEHEVTVSFTASTSYLSGIVLSFKELYPQIDIKINQKPFSREERYADLYIYSSLEQPKDGSETLLLSESCSLAVSSAHPLAARKVPLTAADLATLKEDDFFVIQSHMPLFDITMNLCRIAGFEPHVALECDSHPTIFSLIDAGLGVAVFPDITWQNMLQGWRISMLPLTIPASRNIILKTGDGYLSDAVRLLKEHIIRFYRELP